MLGFGSCVSWSILVRFGVWSILHGYLFFFPASEKPIQIASRKRFLASRKRFHEQRLSKSGESWTRKTKSWNCQYMQFIMKKPIFVFFIELKKQLQLFQSVYWGRVRRLNFLRFGFAHGSSGLRFLRFIGYLIFYGSVPRFRFGSRTLLFNIDTWYTVLAFAPGCLVFWRTWFSFYFPLSQATDRWVCPKMGGVPIHHVCLLNRPWSGGYDVSFWSGKR